MKRTLILLVSTLMAFAAGAQDKFAICKHSKATPSVATYHLYDRAQVAQADFDANGMLVVSYQGEQHSYSRAEIDSIVFTRPAGYDDVIGVRPYNKMFLSETFASSLGHLEVATTRGVAWAYSSTYKCAIATGYSNKKTTPSESYLYAPAFDFTNTTKATLEFDYKMNYSGSTHRVLITDAFTGDPATTEWTTLIDHGDIENPGSFNTTKHISCAIPSRFLGESNVTVAFYYSCNTSSSTWELMNVRMADLSPSQGGDQPDQPGGDDPTNVNRNNVAKSANKEVWRLEFPKIVGDDMNLVITHSTPAYGITYSLEWDCAKRANRWTCYEMYPSNSVSNVKRSDNFREDPDIPTQYQTTLADYSGSGYSRGHLCPSSDRLCSREQNSQTFFLSNMQPQIQAHNGGVWNKLEIRVRDEWNRDSKRDTLYVVKAATIDDANILTHTSRGLIVPKYFYMALLSVKDGVYRALGIWSPHANGSTTEFITIDELEKRTGIDFFCNLPDDIENKVEATYDASYWGRP